MTPERDPARHDPTSQYVSMYRRIEGGAESRMQDAWATKATGGGPSFGGNGVNSRPTGSIPEVSMWRSQKTHQGPSSIRRDHRVTVVARMRECSGMTPELLADERSVRSLDEVASC